MGWEPLLRCTLADVLGNGLGYAMLTGIKMRTYAEKEPDWLQDMDFAQSAYRNCTQQLGGRFWLVHVEYPKNYTYPDGQTASVFFGDWGIDRAVGMCTPSTCSANFVKDIVVPFYWYIKHVSIRHNHALESTIWYHTRLVMDNDDRVLTLQRSILPSIREGMRLRVDEVASWDELDVSWAVIGFPNSGTTTLMTNLNAHPELNVVYEPEQEAVMEEDFFIYRRTSFLPSRADVAAFNSLRATRNHGSVQPRRGVKRPSYIRSDASLSRLSRVPGLVVIVLVRDPVAVAEREYVRRVWQCVADDSSCNPPSLDTCASLDSCVQDCQLDFDLALKRTGKGFCAFEKALGSARRIKMAVRFLGRENVFLADTSELAGGAAFYRLARLQTTSFSLGEFLPSI
eukprot:TRINITY_DN8463_c0_g1_i2.p1 TRINITY_DN8463_c0_g1~~TRINITY_DN8463_c0_g1_i2.p1  ORF type:complete len:398 (+),score=32.89 TRINITY_DN8463_c0_g1_i2:58-1251(+)